MIVVRYAVANASRFEQRPQDNATVRRRRAKRAAERNARNQEEQEKRNDSRCARQMGMIQHNFLNNDFHRSRVSDRSVAKDEKDEKTSTLQTRRSTFTNALNA
jgi:hypothetical protein